MSKKSHRLAIMRDLILSQIISSQEELLGKLKEVGIDATQSTLSRDIKELGAIKVPHPEKGYAYVMPDVFQGEGFGDRVPSLVTGNILGVAFSGNMVVIKTMPGYANAIAVLIDNAEFPFIVGTIAGDDNIFIVLTEDADREAVKHNFLISYPEISTLLQ